MEENVEEDGHTDCGAEELNDCETVIPVRVVPLRGQGSG
jgi:hypothetical protein